MSIKSNHEEASSQTALNQPAIENRTGCLRKTCVTYSQRAGYWCQHLPALSKMATVLVLAAIPTWNVQAQLTNYLLLHSFGGSSSDGRFPERINYIGCVSDCLEVRYFASSALDVRAVSVLEANDDPVPFTLLTGSAVAPLLEGKDGSLIGTAPLGGEWNRGTVFRLNKNGSGYRVIHSFSTNDGAFPNGKLVQDAAGQLYGTTLEGGAFGQGTVFSLTPLGGGFSVIHSFSNEVNYTFYQRPSGSLVEGVDGALYGILERCGNGRVFRLAKDGAQFTVLASFNGLPCPPSDTNYLYADECSQLPIFGTPTTFAATAPINLVRSIDGALYGMNLGTNGPNLVRIGTGYDDYSIQEYRVVPGPAELIEGSDGTLYGAAGEIFKLQRDGSGYVNLSTGINSSTVVEGKDGMIYGEIPGWAFKLNQDGTGYQTVAAVNPGMIGIHVNSVSNCHQAADVRLTAGRDGALYFIAGGGGAFGQGSLFRLGHALSMSKPADHVVLGFTGISGCTYILERTANLSAHPTWTALSTNVMPNTLYLEFEDTDMRPESAFYRLRLP